MDRCKSNKCISNKENVYKKVKKYYNTYIWVAHVFLSGNYVDKLIDYVFYNYNSKGDFKGWNLKNF
jgi:hypothetical protein